MTAGDNMIYKINVTAKDAQGRPLKGIGQSVSVCGGSALEVARFTPFITTHKNFYRSIQRGIGTFMELEKVDGVEFNFTISILFL